MERYELTWEDELELEQDRHDEALGLNLEEYSETLKDHWEFFENLGFFPAHVTANGLMYV